MTTTGWIVLIVGIIVVVAAILFFKVRSRKLQSKFGPEYDRVVRERGSAMSAERELEQREKRVERFKIHPLSDSECGQFAGEWRETQARFVDDPRGALADADRLVNRAMKARGYPVGGEFTQRTADLSVDHPRVVEHYRIGHEIAEADAKKAASTEDLRLAMKHYRALFEDLLGRPIEETTGAKR
jgi:hypothetical protein